MPALDDLLQSFPQRAGAAWPRLQALLVPVSILLLAALIGWQLATLFWRVAAPDELWSPLPVDTVATDDAGNTRTDPDTIIRAQLFGVAGAEPEVAIANAPDTTLNLKLLGILHGDTPEQSRALINTGGSNEAPFAVGADITRGVTLEQIFADRVILMRQGRAETLRLEKDAPATYTAAAEPRGGTDPDAVSLPQLAQVRDQILQDPSQAANYLRIQPASSGGSMQGYRIYPGRDRALFNAAGLRPGDLVTEINGTPLNDASKALEMLTNLSTASNVSLTIERGGNAQSVSISLN
jgi:general secretion pathway protein C